MENEKRLIDGNEALRMMQNSQHDTPCADRAGKGIWDAAHECAISCVNACPTVDAVEVVHAHWEDGCAMHNGKEVYKSIDCSHCEEVFKIESETREYWKARFKVCPFCGAVMDGERREGE